MRATAHLPPHNEEMRRMDTMRDQATFPVESLTRYMYYGVENLETRRAAFTRVETALGLSDNMVLPAAYGSENREQQYEAGVRASRVEWEDGLRHGHQVFHALTSKCELANSAPFGLHTAMFIPSIEFMASDEQKAVWMPLAKSGKMLGTYVQSEMGTATAVQQLETTAVYDPERGVFVFNSPTLTSTKFWPGSLAFSVTHGITMARLITQGKDYGVHPFMVQYRSLEDGQSLSGIEIGDIGLKMAYNRVDNGWCRFTNYELPRENMMMRNAEVLPDGTYRKLSTNNKAAYSTMMDARGIIINWASMQLAQAVTIAMRFSITRAQALGANGALGERTPILEYKHQHYRLFTHLSKAYMIQFMTRHCRIELDEHFMLFLKADPSQAQWNHILSSGYKAWATSNATDGAEDARRCCGGHGYHQMSGLPQIVTTLTAGVTFEGENLVLYLQVFRYLLKYVQALEKGTIITPKLSYMQEGLLKLKQSETWRCSAAGTNFLGSKVQLSIFEHRATRLVFTTSTRYTEALATGLDEQAASNKYMMQMIDAAKAHVECKILATAMDQINNLPLEYKELTAVLTRLTSLFALTTIVKDIGFIEDGFLSSAQLDDVRECIDQLLQDLYPDAIALTDAWDFTDASLCSAIGCKDGNAYERLLAWTRQIPINLRAQKEGGVYRKAWEEGVAPILKAKL